MRLTVYSCNAAHIAIELRKLAILSILEGRPRAYILEVLKAYRSVRGSVV